MARITMRKVQETKLSEIFNQKLPKENILYYHPVIFLTLQNSCNQIIFLDPRYLIW